MSGPHRPLPRRFSRPPVGRRRISLSAAMVAAFVALPACDAGAESPPDDAEAREVARTDGSTRAADANPQDADAPGQDAESSGKPLFSDVTREMIEEEGLVAARSELGMMMTMSRDDYRLDLDGMVALAREYIEAGEAETAVAVANLAWLLDGRSPDANLVLGDAYVAQGLGSSATMYYETALRHDPGNAAAREALVELGGELPEEREARREAERAEREAANASIDRDRGPTRDDLERFKGRYADPDRENRHHVFWFAETCAGSGYLMAGAEWGDVAPWILRSESETVFHQTLAMPGQEALHFEFELGPEGAPTAVTMTGLYDEPARLERLGPLDERWQQEGGECRIDRPGG